MKQNRGLLLIYIGITLSASCAAAAEQPLTDCRNYLAAANPAFPEWKKLADFLYKESGISVSQENTSADLLFPDSILADKKASALGVAGLLCDLAKKSGIPLNAAVFPGGIFLISREKEGNVYLEISTSELNPRPLDYFYRQAEWQDKEDSSSDYFRALSEAELRSLFLLARAEDHFKKSENAQARKLLKQARENIPEIAAFYILEGRLFQLQKEKTAALRSFQKALSLHPKNLEASRYLADAFWTAGDLSLGETYLERILEITGEDIPALEKIVFLKILQHGISEDNADLDALSSLDPENTTVLAAKYIRESLSGRKTEAKATLRLFSRAKLETPYPLLILGIKPLLEGIHINPGFLWRAMEKFREADARFPDNPYVQYLIGLNYFYAGDFPSAISSFAQTAALAPLFSEALLKKAQSHIYLGELENARAPLRKAEAIHPKAPALSFTKALLAFHQGDLKQSLEQIEDAVARAPALEKSGWLLTQAEIALEAGEPALSLRALEQAQESGDFSAKLYELYGRIYFSRNQTDLAEKNLLQAVKAGTQNGKSLHTLAKIYLQKKEYPLAWHYMRAAQRRQIQDPELMNALRQVSREPESAVIKHEVSPSAS